MRLINIDAFLQREKLFHSGRRVERRTKVLEFRDDEATEYAILSHRWIDPTEVDYEEMVNLAKMVREEQDEIRGRQGYKKIVDTCNQAKRDGYGWLWIDTCCIDKQSSAELSEAINSMYRWYANADVCYVYLHDVDGSSFPTKQDYGKDRNGHPEWFSRGWTLQEMIAPQNLQFFNKDWQLIGDKKSLARALERITGVPERILEDGLEGNRPCVAQIISWAANRTTTRVEDRAYSLMGLLDVNMPMLYGEGKKAFHRLQLEVIRSSNDQSIFAWGHDMKKVRIGSILADDPSDFEDCSRMELMDHDEFHKVYPERSNTSIPDSESNFFPITNRGIQIRMPLCGFRDSYYVYRAFLPCQSQYGDPVSIDLVKWNSNYYRYPSVGSAALGPSTGFFQVFLRYQDTPNLTVTFDIDDSGTTENGFICSHANPKNLTGNTFTLTNTDPFCVKTYSEEQGSDCFEVNFGQCFGLDWVHLDVPRSPVPSIDGALKVQMPYGARSMADAPSQVYSHGRLWVCHLQLPGSTWIVRIYRVAWQRSKIRLRLEVFRGSHFQHGLSEWNAHDVEVRDFLVHVDYYQDQDAKGLTLHEIPYNKRQTQNVDGVWMELSLANERTKLGDYGHFTDSGRFSSQRNLFSGFRTLISEVDITTRKNPVTGDNVVDSTGSSLPNNPASNSLLASLAPRLMNGCYLVTRLVESPRQGVPRTWCTIRTPFVLHLEQIRRASLKDDRYDPSYDDSKKSGDDLGMSDDD